MTERHPPLRDPHLEDVAHWHPIEGTPEKKKVAIGCSIGATIETYDFIGFGTAAALYFGTAFFPSADPLTGTLAAFATLGVGFAARPLGGILGGHLGDRVGRKPVYATGMLGVAIMVWPFLWSISQKNVPLLFLFSILMVVVFYSGYAGAAFALWNEQFDTRVRMSGVAVGTQFGFALGGFAPAIAAALAGPKLDNWVPVAVFASATAVISLLAVLTMRETYRTHLYDLGKPTASGGVARATASA